jgi:hypothetical protein
VLFFLLREVPAFLRLLMFPTRLFLVMLFPKFSLNLMQNMLGSLVQRDFLLKPSQILYYGGAFLRLLMFPTRLFLVMLFPKFSLNLMQNMLRFLYFHEEEPHKALRSSPNTAEGIFMIVSTSSQNTSILPVTGAEVSLDFLLL